MRKLTIKQIIKIGALNCGLSLVMWFIMPFAEVVGEALQKNGHYLLLLGTILFIVMFGVAIILAVILLAQLFVSPKKQIFSIINILLACFLFFTVFGLGYVHYLREFKTSFSIYIKYPHPRTSIDDFNGVYNYCDQKSEDDYNPMIQTKHINVPKKQSVINLMTAQHNACSLSVICKSIKMTSKYGLFDYYKCVPWVSKPIVK